MSGHSGEFAPQEERLAAALWAEAHPPPHELGWAKAVEREHLGTMVDVYRRRAAAYLAEGMVPNRWRWCPDCNGEGVITTQAGPDLDEHTAECRRCEATFGIVPTADLDSF